MAILFRIHVLYLGCRARVYVRVLVCVCVWGCVVVACMGMAKRLQDLGTDTKKWTFYAYQYTLSGRPVACVEFQMLIFK